MKEPTLYSSRYFILKFRNNNVNSCCKIFHKLSCDEYDASGFLLSQKNNLNLDSYIVINPAMKDEIESYKIIEASIFEEKYFSIPYVYKKDKSKDSLYTTNYTYYPDKGVFVGDYLGRTIETEVNYLDEEKLYNYSNLNIYSFAEFKAFLVNSVYRNITLADFRSERIKLQISR